jgi:outer membrane protein assembly factor BamB
MSPVVDRVLLTAAVGTNGRGALTALDAATGVEKWSWKGDGPAYASPIVANLGGRQVLTRTQRNIVGVSAATGELMWHTPFSTP